MASKCCSTWPHTLPLSSFSFLKDPSNPKSTSFKQFIKCRTNGRTYSSRRRKALGVIDPNIPSKRPTLTKAPTISASRPESSLLPLPESRLEARPIPPPTPQLPPIPESPSVQPLGFLPANQWKLIQNFYTALDGVQMEYCLRCKERWFSMELSHCGVSYNPGLDHHHGPEQLSESSDQ